MVESHEVHSQSVLNYPSLAWEAWVGFGSSLAWEVRASVVFRILIRMRQSGSGFRSLISMRGESGCGLTNAQGQVLFGGSLRVCSAGPTAHTSHNTKSPLCAPTPWLVMLHTCYLTHHNGALLWKASPLVRTETVHFCGSCRGSSGVSATSFTTEQGFKADAANVITPFLTASALQTMLCNTSRASMGLLRHELCILFSSISSCNPNCFSNKVSVPAICGWCTRKKWLVFV